MISGIAGGKEDCYTPTSLACFPEVCSRYFSQGSPGFCVTLEVTHIYYTVYTTAAPRTESAPQSPKTRELMQSVLMGSHSSQSSSFTDVDEEPEPEQAGAAAAQEPDNHDVKTGGERLNASLPPSQQGSKASLYQADGEASQPHSQPSPATDQRDSSLLNETLSVINEHISTLHSGPPQNKNPHAREEINDSASDYSTQMGGNPYSSEAETDGDDPEVLTEEFVRKWSPKRVANYLRKAGVDPRHCDVFEEQEISGDVFLEIDQSTIFLKEFDFGTMGRRLKTWHKIKAIHDEIWNGPRRTYPFESEDYQTERDRNVRKYDSASFLPRIPSLPGSTDGGRVSTSGDRQLGLAGPSSNPSLIHSSPQSPGISRHSSLRRVSFDRDATTNAYPHGRSATSASHYSTSRLAHSQDATPTRVDAPGSAGGYFSDAGTQHQPRRINKQSISYAGLTTPESAHGGDFESLTGGNTISGRTSQTVTSLETAKDSGSNGVRESKMSGFGTISSAFSHTKLRRAMGLRPSTAGQEKGKVNDKTTTSILPRSSAGDVPGRFSLGSKPSHEQGANSAESSLTDAAPPDIPRRSVVPRTKSKKDTSAYKQGLKKSTPREQIPHCDYYGWMKKRSSNLITGFQSRFFILHGRRLSYYYSENDAEEKGIIDISSHSVLPAEDLLISLHASLAPTKATPSSSSRASHTAETNGEKPKSAKPFTKPFLFKLVPPKAGSPHAVQFTKPTVHYFQVDDAAEGRAWMAALLKATIYRDMSLPIRTTNRQPTVSLRQAANINNRPPTLVQPVPTPSTEDLDNIPDEKEQVQVEIEPATHGD